jgi:predicted DNA-binding protein
MEMTTVRLPADLEKKLATTSKAEKRSKSELIKEALERYFDRNESEKDSYELGKEYFGAYGSGEGTLSTSYKARIKEKLDAKRNTR